MFNKKRRELNTNRVGEAFRAKQWDEDSRHAKMVPSSSDKVEPTAPTSGHPSEKPAAPQTRPDSDSITEGVQSIKPVNTRNPKDSDVRNKYDEPVHLPSSNPKYEPKSHSAEDEKRIKEPKKKEYVPLPGKPTTNPHKSSKDEERIDKKPKYQRPDEDDKGKPHGGISPKPKPVGPKPGLPGLKAENDIARKNEYSRKG